ncbi:MAG: segregation/condensation protein A [Planctomycetota bacterium]|nr:segregation/condensation protein A [Planctomycetota bacterium]
MEYRVQLDIYNGPLDLLLYLIKRDELDIYDIPIWRITDSYMGYLTLLQELRKKEGLDINVAGDFLVMAATLMEIKSAMLLPKPPPDPNATDITAQELTDPRYELVQKLLEYKRFKDVANALERQRELHEDRFARVPGKREGEADDPPPIDLEEVQVWDLLAAFTRLMQEVGLRKRGDYEVVYDETPIDLHAADIEDRLKRDGRLTLRQLFEGRRTRSEMIGVFLALLELVRERKVVLKTGEDISDLVIEIASPEHRVGKLPSGLHLAEESKQRPATEAPASEKASEPKSVPEETPSSEP